MIDRFGDGALGIRLQRDIGLDEAGAQALRGRLSDCRFSVGDDDMRTFLDETLDNAGADSARRPDDQRGAVVQAPGRASLCRIWSLTVSRRTAASTRAPRIICV